MFDIGEFIEYLKENKIAGASQNDVGVAIGKDQAYVSLIKKNQRPFNNEYLELIRKSYGNDIVDDFLKSRNVKTEVSLSKTTNESRDNLSISYLVSAINNISEATVKNANANELNAIANERNSRNMEELIQMLKNDKQLNKQ